MAADTRKVATLPDPVGAEIEGRVLPNGIRLSRRRIPVGVLGLIYEARPNVTIDIATLSLKTGNAVILRGGSETLRSNLALVEMERGRLEPAAAQLEESVEIARDLLGDASPSVALRLENLANVRDRQGDYALTAELLGEVLAIREPVYGADSFPVAKTRFNTGMVSMKAGHYERALELINQAIPVFREHTGEASFEMVGALHNRGNCRAELGDDVGALADFRTALAIADRLDTPTTPGRLSLLKTIADFHCRRGDAAAARDAAKLALAGLDPDDPSHDRWRTAFEGLVVGCSQ